MVTELGLLYSNCIEHTIIRKNNLCLNSNGGCTQHTFVFGFYFLSHAFLNENFHPFRYLYDIYSTCCLNIQIFIDKAHRKAYRFFCTEMYKILLACTLRTKLDVHAMMLHPIKPMNI